MPIPTSHIYSPTVGVVARKHAPHACTPPSLQTDTLFTFGGYGREAALAAAKFGPTVTLNNANALAHAFGFGE
ncbi:hypothetical protein [Sphingorhabdus lutea]|nr:hypothetical protein [Sphingorhabdus lutea]